MASQGSSLGRGQGPRGASSKFKLGCLCTVVCKCLHSLSRLIHFGRASKLSQQRAALSENQMSLRCNVTASGNAQRTDVTAGMGLHTSGNLCSPGTSPWHSYATTGMTDDSQWCEAASEQACKPRYHHALRKACVDAQAPASLRPCSRPTARSSFPEVPARSSLYHP